MIGTTCNLEDACRQAQVCNKILQDRNPSTERQTSKSFYDFPFTNIYSSRDLRRI